MLRATRPINRIPLVVFGGTGVDAASMHVTVDGGRVGRIASGHEVLVIEVLLDRDYRKGELFLLRYAVRPAPVAPVRYAVGRVGPRQPANPAPTSRNPSRSCTS